MLKDLVSRIVEQNPNTRTNSMYLLMSVWDKQGLKLMPNQVEALLNKCSPAASVLRAAQKQEKTQTAKSKDPNNDQTKRFFGMGGLDKNI
jgi:hypothetical protein